MNASARARALAALLVLAGLVVVLVLGAQSPRTSPAASPASSPVASPTTTAAMGDDVVRAQAPTRPPGEPATPAPGPTPTPAPSAAPAAPTRVLPVVTPPPGEGGYAVVTLEPGSAEARFDPCRRVDVTVNPAGGPPGWERLVTDALAAASEASGLSLRLVGTTTERASPDREPVQLRRYGARWAPVLIAWTDEQTIPGLAGEVLAVAGPTWHGTTNDSRLVTGFVYLDGAGLAGTSSTLAEAVLLHEIAHVLGLDHVDDPAQLMYPTVRTAVPTYQDGDLRGLAWAGSGPCTPPRLAG